jgi:large subunit ribosomal protein L29
MEYTEIKTLTKDQLTDQLVSMKKEQLNLRFRRATGQVENTSRIRELRRDIAKVRTAQSAQKNAGKPSGKK